MTSATMHVTLSGAPPRRASFDQGARRRSPGRRPRVEGVAEGVEAHHAGQAVGAEQVPVADAGLAHREVGLDVLDDVAEHPHQHRALGVLLGLLGGEPALVDEGLHEGVVAGDLHQDAVAQQVGARVADVGEGEPAARAQQRGDRRAHARRAGAPPRPGSSSSRWAAATACARCSRASSGRGTRRPAGRARRSRGRRRRPRRRGRPCRRRRRAGAGPA